MASRFGQGARIVTLGLFSFVHLILLSPLFLFAPGLALILMVLVVAFPVWIGTGLTTSSPDRRRQRNGGF